MTPSHSRPDCGNDTARKAVLYCPDCGHASPIEGDWRVELDDGNVVYRCPECGNAVTIRPRHGRVPA